MVDKFPAEQQRIIRVLEQDVERLKTIARTITPIKINKATEYFDLPEGSPDEPESGVRLYGAGGKLGIKTASGQTVTIPMPNVPNPPNFASPSSQSGDYASASAYTALRLDCARLHDTVRDLQNAMRAAGIMASS